MAEESEAPSEVVKRKFKEDEKTLVFLADSISIHWSTGEGPDLSRLTGFEVCLLGTVKRFVTDADPAIVDTCRTGEVRLCHLESLLDGFSGEGSYIHNAQGPSVVGSVSMTTEGNIEAQLFVPSEDFRTLATLLSSAVKEASPVRVWMQAFEDLKDWDGKEMMLIRKTTISIG